MLRFAIFAFIFINSFSAYAKDIVIYINGASANSTWPEKQAAAFVEKMRNNGLKVTSDTELSYYPIPQSQIASAVAINCQREISRESFVTAGVRPTIEEYSIYYKKLGKMYDDMWLTALKNPSCNGTLPGVAKMYSTVLGLAKAIKKIIDEKNNVTIASYSMGNNYAEAAIAYLYHKGHISNYTDVNSVGIGSPAFSSFGQYYNATQDTVIYSLLGESYSLPSNFEFCVAPCTTGVSVDDMIAIRGTKNSVGHWLLEDYLNDSFLSLNHKKKVSAVIAEKINEFNQDRTSEYSHVQISGTPIDPTITLFTGAGAGGLSNAQMAPNDAGVAYGIANYTQGGQTKLGVFFLNQPGGSWYLATDNSQAYTSSSLIGANDLGQAIIKDENVSEWGHFQSSVRYSYLSKANDGSLYKFQLNVPPGVTLGGILNDGSIVRSDGLFDKTMNRIGEPIGILQFGLDGTSDYSTEVYKRVRFFDGTIQTLPCNSGLTNLALSKPTTGRNCSQITAFSGNGVAVGLYYSSDGTQGVYKFSKAGFQEIPIAAQYFGYGTGSQRYSPPRPLGISNAGDVLLSPIYSDENAQTCVGGPYLLTASGITDLKKYIPSGSCFNIQASISGGGRIYLSSQAQGYSGYLVKNQ